MKRFISFMMALALVLSLGFSVAAAETANGSITISNATKDTEYKIYKIFDATYSGDKVSYTIAPDTEENPNPIFVEMFGGDGKTSNTYFTYNAETNVVTKNDGVENSDLFDYLQKLVAKVTPDRTKIADSTSVTFGNETDGYLDPGYYVIVRGNDNTNAVTITTAKPDATVIDKNQLPGGDLDKKLLDKTVEIKDENNEVIGYGAWVDSNSASIGDTVDFKITFTATNYHGADKVLNYTITDTMDPVNWATIDPNSIVVKVGDEELYATKDEYTIDYTADGGFKIEIPWVGENAEGEQDFLYDATSAVEITYSAVVTDKAAGNEAQTNENKVKVEWTDDNTNPDDDDDHEDEGTDTLVLNMGFTKTDDEGNGLEDVTFQLFKADGVTPVNMTFADGVYTVSNAEGATNEFTTPTDGEVVIKGLAAGTYVLKEIETLPGYNKLHDTITVEVGDVETPDEIVIGEDASAVTYKVDNDHLEVVNSKGVELPSTGGAGTVMMITFGTMVAMAFAVLMITQKKMSIYQD